MINYSYTAKDTTTGETVKAAVQAENPQAAAKLLMGQNLFPITIDVKTEGGLFASTKLGGRVGTKDRVIFTRQLSTLINAGLPLTQSLRTARDQITNKTLRTIVE